VTRMWLSALIAMGIHACILWADFGRVGMQPVDRPKPRRVTLMLAPRPEPEVVPASKLSETPTPAPAPKIIKPLPPPKPEPKPVPRPRPEPEGLPTPAPEIKAVPPPPEKRAHSPAMPEIRPVPDSRAEPINRQGEPDASASGPGTESRPETGLKTVEQEQPDTPGPVEKSPPPVIREARPRYRDTTSRYYPILARKRGYQGTVILDVFVDKNGRVADTKVFSSSGYTILDKAARTAVENWLFEPGMKGEERIEMWIQVPIHFQLK